MAERNREGFLPQPQDEREQAGDQKGLRRVAGRSPPSAPPGAGLGSRPSRLPRLYGVRLGALSPSHVAPTCYVRARRPVNSKRAPVAFRGNRCSIPQSPGTMTSLPSTVVRARAKSQLP